MLLLLLPFLLPAASPAARSSSSSSASGAAGLTRRGGCARCTIRGSGHHGFVHTLSCLRWGKVETRVRREAAQLRFRRHPPHQTYVSACSCLCYDYHSHCTHQFVSLWVRGEVWLESYRQGHQRLNKQHQQQQPKPPSPPPPPLTTHCSSLGGASKLFSPLFRQDKLVLSRCITAISCCCCCCVLLLFNILLLPAHICECKGR